MGVRELARLAAEAHLERVPTVVLDRCAELGIDSEDQLARLVYSNRVHELESMAGHLPLHVPGSDRSVPDASIDESAALQRASTAVAEGAALTAASWLISAAMLARSAPRREQHLQAAARKLLGALDVAGALVVCQNASPSRRSAGWNYLRGRVAALDGNASIALELFEEGWQQISAPGGPLGRRDHGRDELGEEIASHAVAVATSTGAQDALVTWTGRSEAAGRGAAGNDSDVDLASRLLLARLIAGHSASERSAIEDVEPGNGALGAAVHHYVSGSTGKALELIDGDIDAAERIGNVAQYTYGQAWRSAFEHRIGNWESSRLAAEIALRHGQRTAWAFAAAGAVCCATVTATTDPDEWPQASEQMDDALRQVPDSAPLQLAADQARAWSALLQGDFERSIELARRWRSSNLASLAFFGGPPITRVGALAAHCQGDSDTSADLASTLSGSTDPGERMWHLLLSGRERVDGRLAHTWAFDAPLVNAVFAAAPVDNEQRAVGIERFASLLPQWCTELDMQRRVANLTERQRAVVDVVLAGKTNHQIARTLSVSVKNVEHHLTAIYRALGVQTRHELVATVRAAQPRPRRAAPRGSASGPVTADRRDNRSAEELNTRPGGRI